MYTKSEKTKIDVANVDTGFTGRLYDDTLAEIERLEGELNFLRDFVNLIGPPAGNSRKSNSPRKNKKKIGRPTNAEKAARERRAKLALARELAKV